MIITKSNLQRQGKNLLFEAYTLAPTLGWQNVVLSKTEYVKPPVNGIQDFVLTATPPVGYAPNAVQQFYFCETFKPAAWCLGVRIINKVNGKQFTLCNPTKSAKEIGTDLYSTGTVGLIEDQLIVDVQYSGDHTTKHSFQLNWDGLVKGSNPVQVTCHLSHNCNGDMGKAIIKETLQFDLSAILGFPKQAMEITLETCAWKLQVPFDPTTCKNSTCANSKTTVDNRMLETA